MLVLCAVQTIFTLLKLLNKEADLVMSFVVKWLTDADRNGAKAETLRLAALQVAGVAAESLPSAAFGKYMSPTVAAATAVLRTHASGDVDAEKWKGAYDALVCMEKAWKANRQTLTTEFKSHGVRGGADARSQRACLLNPPLPAAAQTWRHIVDLTLHPHGWVRLASSRLIGSYLGTSQPTGLAQSIAEEESLFASADELFLFAKVGTGALPCGLHGAERVSADLLPPARLGGVVGQERLGQ